MLLYREISPPLSTKSCFFSTCIQPPAISADQHRFSSIEELSLQKCHKNKAKFTSCPNSIVLLYTANYLIITQKTEQPLLTAMLSKLKKIVSQNPNSKKLVLIEAQSYLETEIAALTIELDATPADRLPSRKLAKSIQDIIDRADAILLPIEKQCHELVNYSDWLNLDTAYRALSFERYATLIGASESITPFATLSEIQKLKDGEDPKLSTELNASYQSAVKALFCHPLFVDTLTERMDKKIKILGETAQNQADLERQKIQQFTETYAENKKWNSALAKNALLEEKMAEMEAIIFLQTQTAIMETGQHMPTEDLAEYINYWMVHLNELTAEQQTQKIVLLHAADTCSAAYNSVA